MIIEQDWFVSALRILHSPCWCLIRAVSAKHSGRALFCPRILQHQMVEPCRSLVPNSMEETNGLDGIHLSR